MYPNPNKPKNRIKEAGTCHISVKDLGIDIKNIVYLVNNDGAIHIHGPARVYKKKPSSPDNATSFVLNLWNIEHYYSHSRGSYAIH